MNEQTEHYSDKLSYEMDAWDLSEALKNGDFIVVIDSRSSASYEEEHIVNALSLPHREMTKEGTEGLDGSLLYVTYCDGVGCNASTKAALNLSRLGFRVKELIGGLDWWKRDGHETSGKSGQRPVLSGCGCN